MKFKGFLSLALVLCMLISMQAVSVFADEAEEENFVTLFATFNNFEGNDMTTEDNRNFFLSTKLDAGSYQFTVNENGAVLSHPTTVKDVTARISKDGIKLSEAVDARCTLLSTGGNYTFEYNTDTDLLKIKKDGTGNPADNGNALKIKTSNQEITANKDSKFTYNVYLKADEIFEDIQAVINFDPAKLSLTGTTAETCCPALVDTSFNTDIKGLVAVNSSNLAGYDFKGEKLLLTLEFTAIGTGDAYLDFFVQDMNVMGGEKSYYFLSQEKATGTSFREDLVIDVIEVPTTAPTSPTVSTEPSETSEATEGTNPTEVTVPTENTNPTETIPDGSTSATDSTEPSETTSTYPTSTTAPASEYELGDVNRDGKLNIRDATLIQKALAKLESLDDEQLTLADYLTDGKVNIKDATQIQKKIANII
ncbi:MAG: hypothetical protein IJ346_05285 [Clostridia bacterium]|nr:hypothetical protein [Clostridia bacterium]